MLTADSVIKIVGNGALALILAKDLQTHKEQEDDFNFSMERCFLSNSDKQIGRKRIQVFFDYSFNVFSHEWIFHCLLRKFLNGQ